MELIFAQNGAQKGTKKRENPPVQTDLRSLFLGNMIDSWSECVTQVKWRTKSGGKKQRECVCARKFMMIAAAHIAYVIVVLVLQGRPGAGGGPRSHRICIRPVARTRLMWSTSKKTLNHGISCLEIIARQSNPWWNEMSQKQALFGRHKCPWLLLIKFCKQYLHDLFLARNTLVGLLKGQLDPLRYSIKSVYVWHLQSPELG